MKRGTRAARLPFLAVLILGAADVPAFEALWLEVGDLQASFGSAHGVALRMELNRPPAVSLHADAVVLPEPLGRLSDVRIDCTAFITGEGRMSCRNAHVRAASWPLAGAQDLRADFAYDARSGRVELQLRELSIANVSVEVDIAGKPADWSVAVRGRGLEAAPLGALAGELGLGKSPPGISGHIDVELQARGHGGGLERIQARLDATRLSGSDASGRLAVDGLALALDLELQARGSGWGFDLQARSDRGQLYLEPWFIEPGEAPLELAARGTYAGSAVELNDWSLRHQGVLTASGEAALELEPELVIERARVHISEAKFPNAYRTWLQPYLYGSSLDALATSGGLEAEFVLVDSSPRRLELTAHDLHIDDTEKRFAIYGLNGPLGWQAEGPPEVSRLSWIGGFAYGIGFGPATLAASSSEKNFRLLEPLVLPVLDGKLRVRELIVSQFGTPELEVGFDAELEPVGMRSLTAALGWPSFSGQLSGRIPDLSYADGVVTLGGDLTAEVFNGAVTVENLQLRNPFGELAQLAADARLRRLDLEALTDTFEIGRIEGSLDGDIENLRLFRWMPVAFDARIYTPPDDDSRHRISQRAVESISSLGGGGAAGALSSGFLQFFESFAYARLGLGCRLENEVCHMEGIAPAPDGYYIVEGKWLPRIDVIGYAERVDWPVLLEQLKSLAKADDVVVR